MNMDENKNINKMRLSEQLPVHSSDPGTWERLSAKLDALDAEAVYQEKLQQLPLHSPDQGIWAIINRRLTRAAYLKIGTRIALTAAAGLLLFITVSRVSDYYQISSGVPQVAMQKQYANPSAIANQSNPSKNQLKEIRKTAGNSKNPFAIHKIEASSYGNRKSAPGEIRPVLTSSDRLAVMNAGTFATSSKETESIAQNTSILDSGLILKESNTKLNESEIAEIKSEVSTNKPLITPIETNLAQTQKEPDNTPISAPVKYYTPSDPKTGSKKNHFALAMDYLPENINNGTNNSLFHNVDLTASYNKEKVRFNTSVGIAYNEEQLEINMNYDIKSPVTAFGPGGKIDTLSYNSASMESQYVGSEKHQYFTYNLGFGRRLFSVGKFSTWINAGAGFGVRLNNPDLVSSTENTIKSQYNAQITRVNTSKPVYNDVNVNFVTGIDFNYKILKRLSITFTPTSRWYFKPVLSKNNQATDELTLGFKTGMKFDF
jgi:hypothetical protein